MKKKLVAGLVTLGAVSMLCGFDNAETAQSLYEKMASAEADLNGMSMVLGMNLDAAVNISDDTTTTPISVLANGSFDTAYTLDPFAMKMDGSLDLSFMGQDESITEQAYIVSDENGAMKTYVYAEDSAEGEDSGSWVVDTNSDIDLNALLATTNASLSFEDLADWGLELTLAPEAATVDDKECYVLSTEINTDTLNTILEKSSELTGEDLSADTDISTVLSLLTGLKLDITYYVDTTTYLPVQMHMDLNDSDLTTLNVLLSSYISAFESDEAASSTVELVLNDASIDVSISYDEVPEITVPDDALAAEASGDTVSLDDLAESVETEF